MSVLSLLPVCFICARSHAKAVETRLTLKGNNSGLSILLCQSRNGLLWPGQAPVHTTEGSVWKMEPAGKVFLVIL